MHIHSLRRILTKYSTEKNTEYKNGMGSRIQNGKTSLKMERKYSMKLKDYIMLDIFYHF